MDLVYGRSKEIDREKIYDLFKICFGTRKQWDDNGYLEGIEDGRYLCAFEGDRLVAVTGIDKKSVYNGLQVTYSCVHPKYRHQGILTKMLAMEITRVGRSKDIYCSCWSTDSLISLHNAMASNGFKLVIKSVGRFSAEHLAFCEKECVNYSGKWCRCREDLYVLRRE